MATGGEKGKINVRRAVPEDLDPIVRFNDAMALETEGKVLDQGKLREGVAAVFQRHGLGDYYVAELAGRVVGQLTITTEWSDWRNSYDWWIQSVYVDADHRRSGGYAALHTFVTEEAAGKGVQGLKLYVDRDNKRAQKVYASLNMSHSTYDLSQIDFESSQD